MCPNQSVCSFPQIPFPSQFLPARENLNWTLSGVLRLILKAPSTLRATWLLQRLYLAFEMVWNIKDIEVHLKRMGDKSIQGASRKDCQKTLTLTADTDPVPIQVHPGHLPMHVEFIYGSWSCKVQWTRLWRSPVCKAIVARWLVTVFWCEDVKTLTFSDSLALYAVATADAVLAFDTPHLTGERKISRFPCLPLTDDCPHSLHHQVKLPSGGVWDVSQWYTHP